MHLVRQTRCLRVEVGSIPVEGAKCFYGAVQGTTQPPKLWKTGSIPSRRAVSAVSWAEKY